MSRDELPGRSCPLAYRYGAASLNRPAELAAETVYAIGGLYGNLDALAAVQELMALESRPVVPVFNGDFHWFDAEPGWFAEVDAAVRGQAALRGNVETEIASADSGAGCGCAYPDEVDDELVARSNRIALRLREAAHAGAAAAAGLARLAALPMTLRVAVGPHRVALLHGDAESLAGWRFDASRLHRDAGLPALFAQAGVDAFASTHTCLPALRCLPGQGVVVNNGAAGMPNFAGTRFGVVSRLSVHPPPAGLPVLYGGAFVLGRGTLQVHALRVAFDTAAWERRFLGTWPEGSDAHRSYWARIRQGPAFEIAQALGTLGTRRGAGTAVA